MGTKPEYYYSLFYSKISVLLRAYNFNRLPSCARVPPAYHVIYIYIFFSYNIIYFCRRCNYFSASVDVSPTEDIIFSFFVANTTSPINDFYSIWSSTRVVPIYANKIPMRLRWECLFDCGFFFLYSIVLSAREEPTQKQTLDVKRGLHLLNWVRRNPQQNKQRWSEWVTLKYATHKIYEVKKKNLCAEGT